MRWPWPLKHRHPGCDGATAKAEAARKLDETEARDPEIRAITDRLDLLRQQNQFAQMIEDALRRHP